MVGVGSPLGVRYAQGGGLTDAVRAVRERIRLQAVERFEREEKNREVATALRVSERSVERRRRAWPVLAAACSVGDRAPMRRWTWGRRRSGCG
ncbi:helix-turn-helix domain-containing protein [Streptomyces sp. NPDC021218]|uniref:helix-turn-helix domain-containing protein n=1 Tax=Streptomyces sp. NPDC021218 TaxID=3365119 RepID=UPI003790A774